MAWELELQALILGHEALEPRELGLRLRPLAGDRSRAQPSSTSAGGSDTSSCATP